MFTLHSTGSAVSNPETGTLNSFLYSRYENRNKSFECLYMGLWHSCNKYAFLLLLFLFLLPFLLLLLLLLLLFFFLLLLFLLLLISISTSSSNSVVNLSIRLATMLLDIGVNFLEKVFSNPAFSNEVLGSSFLFSTLLPATIAQLGPITAKDPKVTAMSIDVPSQHMYTSFMHVYYIFCMYMHMLNHS